MNKKMNSGAIFDKTRKHRLLLWRMWDKTKLPVVFIGLNPSTAGENKPDPTIRRVIQFAKDWGCGGVYMMNLFTIVSSDPSILKNNDDALNYDDTDSLLKEVASKCKMVVFAWGNFVEAEDRARVMISLFPDAHCLQKNNNGTPLHPLFAKGNLVPFPYTNI